MSQIRIPMTGLLIIVILIQVITLVYVVKLEQGVKHAAAEIKQVTDVIKAVEHPFQAFGDKVEHHVTNALHGFVNKLKGDDD